MAYQNKLTNKTLLCFWDTTIICLLEFTLNLN